MKAQVARSADLVEEISDVMDSPLEALLKEQEAAGKLDSTSEFTIDSLRARHKLAKSQLPAQGLWLVKLVQAAVAAGAREIEVGFGKRVVEFAFRCEEWQVCPRKILSLLLSGSLPGDPFLFHLLGGLRGSIYDDTTSSDWSVCDGTTLFKVSFSSTGTELQHQELDESRPCSFHLRTTRPPRWPSLGKAAVMPLKHLLRRTAEEFLAVSSYCWPCPVPLKVDGRYLGNHYRSSLPFTGAGYGEINQQFSNTSPTQPLPTLLARVELERVTECPELPIAWPPEPADTVETNLNGYPARYQKKTYLGDTWLVCRLPREESPGGYLLLTFAHEMDSRVEFVCHGSVCGFHPLPWRSKPTQILGMELPQNTAKIGLRVLLPVPTSDLDLSHFAVREPEAVIARLAPNLKERLGEVVQFCQERKEDFHFRLAPRPDSGVGKVASAVLSTVTQLHPMLRLFIKHNHRSDLNSLQRSLDEA